jgi:hypothetical protein
VSSSLLLLASNSSPSKLALLRVFCPMQLPCQLGWLTLPASVRFTEPLGQSVSHTAGRVDPACELLECADPKCKMYGTTPINYH